jgi:DnaJ-domain-containing protein 1
MTGMELLVVVVFLLLGYWIMSAILNWLSRGGENSGAEEWFRVLEVPQTASKEEIVAAYKQKIGEYHPDKVAQMGEELRALAESKSKQINAAYEAAMKRRQ